MQYRAKKKINFAKREIRMNTFYLNKSKFQKFVHYLYKEYWLIQKIKGFPKCF